METSLRWFVKPLHKSFVFRDHHSIFDCAAAPFERNRKLLQRLLAWNDKSEEPEAPDSKAIRMNADMWPCLQIWYIYIYTYIYIYCYGVCLHKKTTDSSTLSKDNWQMIHHGGQTLKLNRSYFFGPSFISWCQGPTGDTTNDNWHQFPMKCSTAHAMRCRRGTLFLVLGLTAWWGQSTFVAPPRTNGTVTHPEKPGRLLSALRADSEATSGWSDILWYIFLVSHIKRKTYSIYIYIYIIYMYICFMILKKSFLELLKYGPRMFMLDFPRWRLWQWQKNWVLLRRFWQEWV